MKAKVRIRTHKRARTPSLRVVVASIGVLHKRLETLERRVHRMDGGKAPIGFTFAQGDQVEFDEDEDEGWEIDTTGVCRRRRG